MRRTLLSALLLVLTLLMAACAASAKTLKKKEQPVSAKSVKAGKTAQSVKAKTAKAKAAKAKGKKATAKKKEDPRRIPKYTMSLRNVNTREAVSKLKVVDVDPKNKNKQRIAKSARQRLSKLLRDVRTNKTREVPERLLWNFYLVAQHFDAPVTIISGYRGKARKTSRHARGFAIDFRVEGVDPRRVWEHCKSFKNVGCGYYPTSGFVHMDVRDKSYAWIDTSGPGEAANYVGSLSEVKKAKVEAAGESQADD